MDRQIVGEARTLDKSALFVAFNKARAKAAELDRKRVNRALGYIQAGRIALLEDGNAVVQGEGDIYYVTKEGCECPDHVWRGKKCKHMVARWLLMKMTVLRGPEPTPIPPAPPCPPLDVYKSVNALYGVA